jgi:hypothetical protein
MRGIVGNDGLSCSDTLYWNRQSLIPQVLGYRIAPFFIQNYKIFVSHPSAIIFNLAIRKYDIYGHKKINAEVVLFVACLKKTVRQGKKNI